MRGQCERISSALVALLTTVAGLTFEHRDCRRSEQTEVRWLFGKPWAQT
jgi:hypothetical protein